MRSLTWKDVKVKVITKEYEKGVTYSKSEMEQYESVNIIRDEQLSKWSIRIIPNSQNCDFYFWKLPIDLSLS